MTENARLMHYLLMHQKILESGQKTVRYLRFSLFPSLRTNVKGKVTYETRIREPWMCRIQIRLQMILNRLAS